MSQVNGYSLRILLRKAMRQYPIGAGPQALHGLLIDICNEVSWKTSFQVSNNELMSALICSEKTLVKDRQILIDAGLINYASGQSKRSFGFYTMNTELGEGLGVKFTPNPSPQKNQNSGTVIPLDGNFTPNQTTIHNTVEGMGEGLGVNIPSNSSDYIKLKGKLKEIDVECVALNVPARATVISETFKKNTPEVKNAGAKKFVPPGLQDAKEYFLKVMGNPKKSGHWPTDKCENEAGRFYDHYTANGWKQGRGKPIVDWPAACHNWIRNEREGNFSAPARGSKPTAAPSIQKPVLTNLQKEINFLYETYCEFPERYLDQLINIEVKHYGHLKEAGLVNFSDEQKSQIKIDAGEYMKEMAIPVDDASELKYMKKFGVITYFKSRAQQGKERIFDTVHQPAVAL